MGTPSLSLDAALARIDATPWTTLPGDRDDLARLRDGLRAWVASADRDEADDGRDQALDLAHYVGEIEPAAAELLELALALLAYEALVHRASLVALGDALVTWSGKALRERARDGLAPWLNETGAPMRHALVAIAFSLFGDASLTPPWRAMLETYALDATIETRDRAAAIVALARGGAARPLIERLLREGPPPDIAEAIAFALRLGGAPLTSEERAHVEAHGQPSQMVALFSRARLPGDAAKLLPPFEQEASALEPAEVVFAGAALVQVKHATRGSFTLRIPGDGLAAGATVWIGDVVPPPTHRPLRVEWKVGTETRRARFALDGQRIE